MAGYIFNLDSIESLMLYVNNGVYSTKINYPGNHWKGYQEATFADYATMKAGDNVYFFIDRKIYGIGELVDINGDCKFSNFPLLSSVNNPLAISYDEINGESLWSENVPNDKFQPWVCFFKPSPYFFTEGIDMDDVLISDPNAFKMLRAFWKVSFIKFDNEENQALKSIILKFNQDYLNEENNTHIFNSNYIKNHTQVENKIQSENYALDVSSILSYAVVEDGRIKHEMALEAGILFQLFYGDNETIEMFGNWDYLSHQVIASPFKPIDYMDKMDIFGSKFITGFSPIKSKYLVIELKKDSGNEQDIDQLMKYVDWIKDEYCHGDYSMIDAFLVAFDFSDDINTYKNNNAIRNYIVGRRPAKSLKWDNLKIVKYIYNRELGKIEFLTNSESVAD
jgi:hypothetical protein